MNNTALPTEPAKAVKLPRPCPRRRLADTISVHLVFQPTYSCGTRLLIFLQIRHALNRTTILLCIAGEIRTQWHV